MTITLYDLSVPTFLQTTRAMSAILAKAATHCAETGVDADHFVDARLRPDMAPFHFQIEAMTHHAVWGVEATRTGAFAPPPLVGARPFAELMAVVDRAAAALETFDPDEVNRASGRVLDIALFRPVDEAAASTSAWAPRTIPLTPETFILTYSLPNFYFHAVTAYAILRTGGVPIGKGDYEGRLRARIG